MGDSRRLLTHRRFHAAIACGVLTLLFAMITRSSQSLVLGIVTLVPLGCVVRNIYQLRVDIVDHRRFAGFAGEISTLSESRQFDELFDRSRAVMETARARDIRMGAMDIAAFAAIRSGDAQRMRGLLSAFRERNDTPPAVLGNLLTALEEHGESLDYWEAATLAPGGAGHLPRLIYAIVATGQPCHLHTTVCSQPGADRDPSRIEWVVWRGRGPRAPNWRIAANTHDNDWSPWDLSNLQLAAHRLGEYQIALDLGASALVAVADDTEVRSVVLYNRACSLALLEDGDGAEQELQQVTHPALLNRARDDDELVAAIGAKRLDRLVTAVLREIEA